MLQSDLANATWTKSLPRLSTVGFPPSAFTTCRANHFFPIPIDLKVRDIKTIPLYLLPTTIALRRADQIDVILTPTFYQVAGFNISGINQMFVR
jgi:hypothetical protein